jgi:hypothetical protein
MEQKGSQAIKKNSSQNQESYALSSKNGTIFSIYP